MTLVEKKNKEQERKLRVGEEGKKRNAKKIPLYFVCPFQFFVSVPLNYIFLNTEIFKEISYIEDITMN